MIGLTRCPTPGVRVAVGEPGAGLDGFRRTLTDAQHARRVATDAKLTGCVRYADVAVMALATGTWTPRPWICRSPWLCCRLSGAPGPADRLPSRIW